MKEKKFRGAIFDLDGVITGTARVHSLAWESMFNDFLKRHGERAEELEQLGDALDRLAR